MTKNNWVCSICLESDDKDCYTLKPCNHKFHSKCLIECLRKCGPRCPYCRCIEDSLKESDFRVNVFNTGWIDNIFNDDISSIEDDNSSQDENSRISILDDIEIDLDLVMEFAEEDPSFNQTLDSIDLNHQ